MEKTSIKQLIRNCFKFPNLWGSIIPINILGIVCVYNIASGQAVDLWWLYFILGYIGIKMIGVAAGYHRLFSHKAFEVHPLVRKVILWLGIMAGQGSPIFWIGIHRGYHHRYSDRLHDAHSPQDGFWHSYILWMFKRNSTSLWGLAPRSIIDLLKDPVMLFCHKNYIKILWCSHLVIALIDINLWLYMIVLPAFLTLHIFCLQTSITHYTNVGYKNYPTKDNSTNIPWLFPFILGECWHNNHHGQIRNPNFGGRRWWELDPTYWVIKLIRTHK
jgi:stearoyl-CoA desaturase (delta-9 desaturase)